MRAVRRVLIGIAVSTVFIGVLASVPETRNDAQAAPATGCSHGDVIYYGVRGSGQTAETDTQTRKYYSDSLTPAARRAGLQSRSITVNYTAAPVDANIVLNPAGYIGSYSTGVELVKSLLRLKISELRAEGRSCSNAKLVLGGYSQGALVVHRVLQQQSSVNGLTAHFGGAILFADPDRLHNDGTNQSATTFYLGRGIAQAFSAVSGASRTPLTGIYARNTYSVCMPTDVVCDYSGLHTNRVTAPVLVPTGVRWHLTAYQQRSVPPYYGVAAGRLSTNVATMAQPPTSPDTTTTPSSTTTSPSEPPSATNCADLVGPAQERILITCVEMVKDVPLRTPHNPELPGVPRAVVNGTARSPGTVETGRTDTDNALAALGLRIHVERISSIDQTYLSGTPTAPPGVYRYPVHVSYPDRPNNDNPNYEPYSTTWFIIITK